MAGKLCILMTSARACGRKVARPSRAKELNEIEEDVEFDWISELRGCYLYEYVVWLMTLIAYCSFGYCLEVSNLLNESASEWQKVDRSRRLLAYNSRMLVGP